MLGTPDREFRLEVDVTDDGVTLVAVFGDIDRSTSPQLSDSLRRAAIEREGAVLVDLCHVSFMDSSGISVLVNALRRLARNGRQLLLACPPGNVRRIFELTGLTDTFEIFSTRSEALSRP